MFSEGYIVIGGMQKQQKRMYDLIMVLLTPGLKSIPSGMIGLSGRLLVRLFTLGIYMRLQMHLSLSLPSRCKQTGTLSESPGRKKNSALPVFVFLFAIVPALFDSEP